MQQGLLISPNTLTNTSMKKSESSVVVVADTSGLMSLLVDTDANHGKALTQSAVFDESPGAVVISSHVFTELMNVLGKKRHLLDLLLLWHATKFRLQGNGNFGFEEVFRKNGYRLPEAANNQQAA